jgi:hypothetical protein
MSTKVPNNENEQVRGEMGLYGEISDLPQEDSNPGFGEGTWQRHLDVRFGTLTEAFSRLRAASENERRAVGQLFKTKDYESQAALLSLGGTKTAARHAP